MPSADLVILSTRVVTPEGVAPAAVAITDGVITAVHDRGAAQHRPARAPGPRGRARLQVLPGSVGDRRVSSGGGEPVTARDDQARGARASPVGARRAPRPDRAGGGVARQRPATLRLVSRL